jgi:HAMP domain-containing protein
MNLVVPGVARRERIARPSDGLPVWRRLLIIATVAAVLPLATTGLVMLQTTRDRLTELSVANLHQRSASTAVAIDTYLQSRRRDILLVSQQPDVIAFTQNLGDAAQRDAARAALSAAAAITPAYESIAVLNLDGTIVAASTQSDEGTNVRFRDYFQNARTGSVYISDPSYSVITNQPALFLSAPVRALNGVLVGVVRSRLNLSQIWDLTESDAGSVGAGAHAFLVDDYGIRVAVSETKGNRAAAESLIYKPIAPIDHDTAVKLAADKRFGQKTADQLIIDPLPELAAIAKAIPVRSSVSFALEQAGVAQRGVATKLETKPWIYVVAMPPSSYTSVLDAGAALLVGGVVLAAALGIAAALWLNRSLTRPIRAMAALATHISAGFADPFQATFRDLAQDEVSEEVAAGYDGLLLRLRTALRGSQQQR